MATLILILLLIEKYSLNCFILLMTFTHHSLISCLQSLIPTPKLHSVLPLTKKHITKYVERGFSTLKLKFLSIVHPINLHNWDDMHHLMLASILQHNMMVEAHLECGEVECATMYNSIETTASVGIWTVMMKCQTLRMLVLGINVQLTWRTERLGINLLISNGWLFTIMKVHQNWKLQGWGICTNKNLENRQWRLHLTCKKHMILCLVKYWPGV